MEVSYPINIVYIDAANLHRALKDLGWDMDYGHFRRWLSYKYNIQQAFIFIGYLSRHDALYKMFKDAGFDVIFKTVAYQESGSIKGNCDAELIIKVMEDFYENRLREALLVSSDGDFATLVKKLLQDKSFIGILSPATPKKCSILLKKTGASIAYIADHEELLKKRLK